MEEKNQPEVAITEKDWFLQSLVDIINNREEMSLGITILTHGFLVSGTLVGGKEYFNGFGKEIDEGTGTKEGEISAGERFSQIGKDVYSEEKQAENNLPTYIHLKNAKYYHTNGNPIPGNRGVWWRGRLTEVSGFSLGTLNPG